MNVLMFGWEFPPNISGGLGTACHGIVKGLISNSDINITFVVPKAFGNESCENIQLVSADQISIGKENQGAEDFVSIKLVEVPSDLIPYVTPEIFEARNQSSCEIKEKSGITEICEENKIYFSGHYGPSLFQEIQNYAIVARTIATKYEFDVIHAHDWLTFPAAMAAKEVSGKPLIIHIHSTDFDRSGGSVNPLTYEIEKQGMDRADHIISVSNRVKFRLIESYNIPPEKITTVYNAIEPNFPKSKFGQNQKSKQKTVTFLGRITIQKGPEFFVEVARLVINQMKNVHFVMAGNGEMRDRIIELCARYGIGDKIHFTGFLNGNEVTKILLKSDLLIMPSVSEPFGIVPLEAMQARVPVIVSIQSGVSELIKNIIKTDFWDVHAMADAVHGILKYRRLSKNMVKEGYKEVNKLSWNCSARQIKQVYLQTIKLAS
jgi:glycosyltransferase involved in cell wall biosynthesis